MEMDEVVTVMLRKMNQGDGDGEGHGLGDKGRQGRKASLNI